MGVVFALTGFFLVRAAWDYDPNKARGLDGALRQTVADSDPGRMLVGVVAVGLVAFGLYCYAEAAGGVREPARPPGRGAGPAPRLAARGACWSPRRC